MTTQSMEALARANEIRMARAELKRDIRARRHSLADVLNDDFPEWLGGMRVDQLLGALPGLSSIRISRLCSRVPVSPRLRLQSLTARQKSELARLLIAWEGRAEKTLSRYVRMEEV